jgi:hypothetical protein
MKPIASSLLLAMSAAALSACAIASGPTTGFLYRDTANGELVLPGSGSKTGKACQKSYLGAVATGDSSIETAKKAGGITKVSTVDSTSKNFLVYAEYCTVVWGS